MSDIKFAQIESALVTRIDDQISYLVQCASYAGQIEDANNGLPVEAPACFVMLDGVEVDTEQSDRYAWVARADFSVLVVADSYHGSDHSRTDEHGAYDIIDDVIAAVDDHNLSLTGFTGAAFQGLEMVSVTKLRAMYRVRFLVTITVTR